jgi:hypothetical protein
MAKSNMLTMAEALQAKLHRNNGRVQLTAGLGMDAVAYRKVALRTAVQVANAALASIVSRFRTNIGNVVDGLGLNISDSGDLEFYNCLLLNANTFEASFTLAAYKDTSGSSTSGSRYVPQQRHIYLFRANPECNAATMIVYPYSSIAIWIRLGAYISLAHTSCRYPRLSSK